jgi:hypothetical protein
MALGDSGTLTGALPCHWIEDGHLVEMIGHGGQELGDLITAAEQLGKT